MSKPNITTEFLFAGNARFLVTNPEGTQYTFRVKKWESKRSGKIYWFVDAQERAQTITFVKMGTLEPNGEFKYGGDRAELPISHTAIPVFEWAVLKIIEEEELPEDYDIRHTGNCGACGRPLSVEESVIRGIGPVCYGKAVEMSKRVKLLKNEQQVLFA